MARSLLAALNEAALFGKQSKYTKEFLLKTQGGRTLPEEEREEMWKKIEAEGGYECLA